MKHLAVGIRSSRVVAFALLAGVDLMMSNAALGDVTPHVTSTSFTFSDVCPTGGSGNGNGIIDPGETVIVRVTIQNDGNVALTNISGSLSTTASGVSVVDGDATWPDLAPGASASSNPDHFEVVLSRGVPCGTSIGARLHAFYDQGSNLTGFLLETGAASNCNVCAGGGGDPGEAGVSAPLLLSRSSGNIVFDWGEPGDGCITLGYSLYKGDLRTLRSTGYSHSTSLTCGAASSPFSLPANDPLVGTADYYLVVSHNGAAEGSYGRDSIGIERPPSGAACLPLQNLSSCGP